MLTKEQIEQRKTCLGSSDMAAILGLDPFRNAADVYLEKTDKLKEQKESKVMKRGNYLEPAILNYAEDVLGDLVRNCFFSAPDNLPIGANVDAMVMETNYPVEAKSVGLFVNEHWGEEGSDEIPDRVIIQCHVHMICIGKDFCHVPVYLSAREFVMFGVSLSKSIKDIIYSQAQKFWSHNVQADIPPEDIIPTAEVMKRIRREPETIVDIPENLLTYWQESKEARILAEKIEGKSKAILINALGVSEAGQIPNGDMVTYLSQTRRSIDSKKLKSEKPKIAAEYLKETTYPVLRLKKAK